MLPQEKFVHSCLYDGNFLGRFSMFNAAAVDGVLQSCLLKYRKGKGVKDLQNAYKEEWWHTSRISDEELDKYNDKLLKSDNIIFLYEQGLIAYLEYWRITEKQLKEIMSNENWSAYNNNITDGNICFVANIWIDDYYRGNKEIDKTLKDMFLEKNKHCEKFIWKRNRLGKKMKLFTHMRRKYGK